MFTYGSLLLVILVIFCLVWGVRLARFYQNVDVYPTYAPDVQEELPILPDYEYQRTIPVEPENEPIDSETIDVSDLIRIKQFAKETVHKEPWYSEDAIAARTVLAELSAYEDAKIQAQIHLSKPDYEKWKQAHPPIEALRYAASALNYERAFKNQSMIERQQ